MRTDKGRILALAALSVVLVSGSLLWKAREELRDPTRRSTIVSRLFRAGGNGSRFLAGGGEKSGRGTAAKSNSKSDAEATPVNDTPLSCSLVGTVRDEDGKTLKGAKITVRPAGTASGKSFETDEDGRFLAGAIQPGTYDVLAGHPQYVTLIRPSFTLNTPGKSTAMDFILPLGAAMSGSVTDEDGKPLKGVRVGARRHKMEQLAGGSVFVDDATYKTQQTNAEGEFKLAGVALGDNLFEFRKPGYQMVARKLQVLPDKAKDPLKIVLKKTGVIAGAVLNEKGEPLSTTTVYLTRYKPFGGAEQKLEKDKFTTQTDSTGKFAFGKLFNEGFYDILVENEGYAPGMYPLVSVGTEKLTCVLERGGRIEGRTQLIDRESTAVSVMLMAEAVIKGTTFTRHLKSDGAGNFAFTELPYGTYKIKIDSLQYTGEPKTDLACSKGTPVKGITVEVYEASVARGRVSDSETDKPVAGATVTVTSTFGPQKNKTKSFETRTNSHGEFELRKLPGGTHVVQASARGFIKRQTDRSQMNFIMDPGERKTDLALLLDHGGSVEGFVLDTRGRSVAACDVQLFVAVPQAGQPDMKTLKGRTDSTGYFKIWGIDIGERLQLYASVRKAGYAKARSRMMTLTNKESDGSVQVILEPGGMLLGKVLDGKNLPVPGTEIKFTSYEFPNDPSPSHMVAYAKADGSFKVPNCSPGKGKVDISRSGFIKQSREVSVAEEKPTGGLNFVLEQGMKIRGVVSSLEGKPIANAKVAARPIDGARGSDDDITDKKGEFELTNLGPGNFQLEATFKLPTADGELSYRFVTPKVAAGNPAAAIDCDLGNLASGYVQDEEGKAVPSFTVSLHSRTDTKPAQDFTFNLDKGFSATKGVFRVLNAPRGVYSMTVTAEGFQPYTQPNVYIGPHKSTTIGLVELKAAGGVTGTVISSTTGKPVNGVAVKLIDPSLEAGQSQPQVAVARTDFSGSFRVSTVREGSYNLEFEHPSYMSAHIDGIPVYRKKTNELGEFTLQAGGAVQGTIIDEHGDPVSGLQISVSGIYPRKETRSDAAGNYLLQGVRPGHWPIVVKGDLNSRKVYAFSTVAVAPDDSEKADFRLETSAHLEGFVTAAAEAKIKSGSVRIHPFDENANVLEDIHYDAKVQSQEFKILAVPPGQYFLWVSGMGALGAYTAWQELFLNRGNNTTNVNMPLGLLRGRIADRAGEAVMGVGLQLFPVNKIRVSRSLYNSLVKTAFSGKDGKFSFPYLMPGNYQLLYQEPSGSNWMAMPPFSIPDVGGVDNYNFSVDQPPAP